MTKRIFRTVILLIIIAFFAYSIAYKSHFSGFNKVAIKKGDIIEPFTLPDIFSGKKIGLKQIKGEKFLITFWTPTCPTCFKELTMLANYKQLLTSHHITVVTVLFSGDNPNRALRVASRFKGIFMVLSDAGSVFSDFGINTVPFNILINNSQKIIMTQTGMLNLNSLIK